MTGDGEHAVKAHRCGGLANEERWRQARLGFCLNAGRACRRKEALSSGCCQLSLLGEHYVIYQINRQEFDSLACVKASFRHEQLLHSGTPIVSRIPYPKRRSVPRTGISLTGQSCSSLSPLHLAPIAGSIHRRLPPLPPYTYTFLPLSQITHPDPIGPISRPINTQLVILYAR